MVLWTLYRNFKALYIICRDFKLEFQYHSAIKMCVLKFQHSMEYFCIMKQSNKQCGSHFALKLAMKCEILRFYIALLIICSAFEVSMTILIIPY
jgi:hypothetical protein